MGVIDDQGLTGLKRGLDERFETGGTPGVTTVNIGEGSTSHATQGASVDLVWYSIINDSIWICRGVGLDIVRPRTRSRCN